MTSPTTPLDCLEELAAALPPEGPTTAWLDDHLEEFRKCEEGTTWSVICKRLGLKPGNFYAWLNRRGLRTKGPGFKHKRKRGNRDEPVISVGVSAPTPLGEKGAAETRRVAQGFPPPRTLEEWRARAEAFEEVLLMLLAPPGKKWTKGR